ncbi:MAG TPA: ROK family protein [Victivallales bacterium]|nr:ROK family protein [Victivallales bacterium]
MNICCFDIGGTSIKYGIVSNDGMILEKGNFLTPSSNCKKTIPEKLIEYTNEFKKEYKIKLIGISTAGYVDCEKGMVTYSLFIPGYNGCKIVELVEKGTGIETLVENDANAAALGEMWVGAGKNHKNIACITIGTGIGGAIILNRKLYAGSHGFAGEMGEIRVSSVEKNIGTKATLHKCASTRGLLDNYKKLTGNNISGIELMKLVKNDDSSAVKTFNEFLNNLATGIITVAAILDTEAIVVGGGMSAQGDYVFKKLNKIFRDNVLPVYRDVNIVKAELENDAGLLGACYIALNKDYSFNFS